LKYNKLAIFAAAGIMPCLAIQKALQKKMDFIVIGFKHISNFPELEKYAGFKPYQTHIGMLKSVLKILKKENITSILLVGKINKVNLFKIIRFDATTLNLFFKLKDYSDSSILQGVVDFYAQNNIKCLSQKEYFSDLIIKPGCLTKKKAPKKDIKNIKWGFTIAKKIAALNIGQSVITSTKVIISVEGIEGTDAMIKRSQPYLLKKNYFIKVAREGHNPMFDLPGFGLNTLKLLKRIGISVIGLEKNMVLIPEIDKVIDFANKNYMVIYGL